MALSRATGMDTKTSSAWAELLKVRGIDTGKFQVGMVKLSKTMEAARGGNEKAMAALQGLGVSQEAMAKGDIDRVPYDAADAFAAMTNPAEKAGLRLAAVRQVGHGAVADAATAGRPRCKNKSAWWTNTARRSRTPKALRK
jgi:hypothetical protein